VRQRRAVEDRHLGPVEVDAQVVEVADPHRGEQVLDRRDRHVVAPQAGGELDRAHLAGERRDLDAAAVGAPEDDSGAGWISRCTSLPVWIPTPEIATGRAMVFCEKRGWSGAGR